MSGKNYLEMSDEEFMKLPEAASGLPESTDTEVQEEKPVTETNVTEANQDEQIPEEPEVTTETEEPKPEGEAEKVEGSEVEPEKKEEKVETKVSDNNQESTNPPASTAGSEEVKAPDYEGFYKQVIAPIKANGKTIEIKSPEDAIRLMQMGAGFGRKMQDIQPHLKTLRLLEQNNLLNVDQSQLQYLIDLNNKNPDAIKKLVKDAGIDPLDLGNNEPVNYTTKVAPVTDQEVAFNEAISDLKAAEGGNEMLNTIITTWDQDSHSKLMEQPQLLDIIHQQKQAGMYDLIVKEMDYQKAVGKIPHGTPFLTAYRQVGDHLQSTNGFATLANQNQKVAPVVQQPATPQVIDRQVVAPKSSVSNNAQAKAAATTRQTPRVAKVAVNPLAMSDEEFEKAYGGKLG